MTAGLQTFNEDGTLALDATYSVPKFIQVIPLSNSVSNGRVYIPLWETQQPWFVALTSSIETPLYAPPTIYADGAYIVWDKRRQAPNQSILVGHR